MSAHHPSSSVNPALIEPASPGARPRVRWEFSRRPSTGLRRVQPLLMEREESARRRQRLLHRQHPS